MAFQFVVGVSVGFAGSVFLTHHIRDRMNLSSLVVEKKLDKKMVELKYQKMLRDSVNEAAKGEKSIGDLKKFNETIVPLSQKVYLSIKSQINKLISPKPSES